jgi:TRAP-type C4-dicarboxylate transport system permease small subunit
MRALHAFCAAEAWLSRALLMAGAAALAAMAGVAMWQILARFVLGDPSTWSEVVSRSLMVWSVFLCTPWVVGRGELMAFDLLRRVAPPATARVVGVGVGLATLVVFAVLCVYGTALAQRAATQSLAGLEFLGAKVSWVYAAIPLGSAAAMVAALAQTIRAVAGIDDPAPRLALEETG